MYTIGMAYRGTANNYAIQKLLHFAVSDVADDVRRAAVLCLGFVLMGVPEQCPRIVALLAESYNPHMRYGAPSSPPPLFLRQHQCLIFHIAACLASSRASMGSIDCSCPCTSLPFACMLLLPCLAPPS